jgi:hypothetical protein
LTGQQTLGHPAKGSGWPTIIVGNETVTRETGTGKPRGELIHESGLIDDKNNFPAYGPEALGDVVNEPFSAPKGVSFVPAKPKAFSPR